MLGSEWLRSTWVTSCARVCNMLMCENAFIQNVQRWCRKLLLYKMTLGTPVTICLVYITDVGSILSKYLLPRVSRSQTTFCYRKPALLFYQSYRGFGRHGNHGTMRVLIGGRIRICCYLRRPMILCSRGLSAACQGCRSCVFSIWQTCDSG